MILPIAIAQFRPDKGDYPANLARMGRVLGEVGQWPVPPAVVAAPEAALTGYFLEGGVQELALPAEKLFEDLSRVHRESGAPPLDVSIGFYELWRNHLHNSALYASLGGTDAGIRHVHRKVFLPTYGVFDEERFVEPGRSVQAFDTRWGRAAMLICEDAWHSLAPTLAALDGAQVLFVPSASPARGLTPRPGQSRPANLDRWDRLAQEIAEEHGIYVAVSHLVGFEGGKGFVGGSVVAGPRGALYQAPVFEAGTVPMTLDFEEITRARAEAPLLSDLQVRLPHLLEGLNGGDGTPRRFGVSTAGQPSTPGPERTTESPSHRSRRVARYPPTEAPLDIDPGPHPAVAGRVHPGRDPAAAKVRPGRHRSLRRGGQRSGRPIWRPRRSGPTTSSRSGCPTAARAPRASLTPSWSSMPSGIQSRTVDITAAVDGIVAGLGGETTPARQGNVMARVRMITLFDLSAELHALPLGTGNKTERLLRLLHLARRRLATGQPDRRPLQDPGLGAGPAPRRARGDRHQAGQRRPDHAARPTRATSASPTPGPT